MDLSILRQFFRRALQASVIAPVALAGCGPDTTGYTPAECGDLGGLSVRGLAPSVIPDVIELRTVSGRNFEADAKPVTLSSEGTACATATTPATCQADFAALSPMSGFAAQCLQICVDYHLATTRGDEVKAVASLDELKTFLGPIDTGQEALFIAFANGYSIACGRADQGSVKPVGTGWNVIAVKGFACGEGTALTRHYLSISREGELTETGAEIVERGAPNCAIGRRPPGLSSSGGSDCVLALGRFFAEAAHLEAASVPAFERLGEELRHHGAPESLRLAVVSAALEELEHTRITAELARGFGAQPAVPEVQVRPLRSVLEIALDNAVEGCVRETFGALVAEYQSIHAGNDQVRAAMTGIARDELRHAEISWEIDRWIDGQLSARERSLVREARRAAVVQLQLELREEVEPSLVLEAGLPSAEISQRMLAELAPLCAPSPCDEAGRGPG